MAQKSIIGDLNVNGEIKQNGIALPTESGTKLYRHIIRFTYATQSGTGKFGIATPIYIISHKKNKYSLYTLLVFAAEDCESIADDNSVIGSYIRYDELEEKIICGDAFGDVKTLETITNFSDTVTEL